MVGKRSQSLWLHMKRISAMEENAYLTALIAGSFYMVASARLLRLSMRTRELPELMLSVYFAATGLYYLIAYSPNYPGFEPLSPFANIAINWIFVLGVFPFLLFIRRVFRPESAWALALVWICGLCLVAGGIDATRKGGLEEVIENPWFIVEWFGYAAPAVWIGCEAALSYRGASKRAEIGLCEPGVVNRYLILAWFGCFQTLACLAGLYWAYDNGDNRAISVFADALLGGCEIASVGTLWLAFFPPAIYRKWILERSAGIGPAPEG